MPRPAALPLDARSLNEATLRRFWSKVDKRGPDECWEWTASKSEQGYGSFRLTSTQAAVASRLSFAIEHGTVDPALVVDHLCRNPPCVNPRHLEAVTHEVNISRGIPWMAGITRCKRGHLFSPENTRHITGKTGNPERVCRACQRDHSRAEKARIKADPERAARARAQAEAWEAANVDRRRERERLRHIRRAAAETPAEREARLAYHREYNRTYKRKS